MKVSGGAASSAAQLRGHGLQWHSEHLAEITARFPGTPYVVDHSSSITAVAGHVVKASSTRFTVEHPTYELDATGWPKHDDKGKLIPTGKTKAELATRVDYVAELHERHPGYKDAATHIMASKEAKVTPHNSISLAGKGITYDAETDRVILEGPFDIIHLGLVSAGASPPELGVGVFDFEPVEAMYRADVDFKEGEPEITLSAPLPSRVVLANAADLFIKFAEKNGYEHEATLIVAAALGIDPEPPAPGQMKARTSNTGGPAGELRASKEESHMPDDPPDPKANPAPAPAALPPEVMAKLAKIDEIDSIKAELADAKKERDAAVAASLKTKRESISAAFPTVKADSLVLYTTMEQLESFESSLNAARGGTPLPRKASTDGLVFAYKGGEDQIKKDEEERQAWLKSIDASVAVQTRPFSGGR